MFEVMSVTVREIIKWLESLVWRREDGNCIRCIYPQHKIMFSDVDILKQEFIMFSLHLKRIWHNEHHIDMLIYWRVVSRVWGFFRGQGRFQALKYNSEMLCYFVKIIFTIIFAFLSLPFWKLLDNWLIFL